MKQKNIKLIFPHLLFIIGVLLVAFFMDPRPDIFIKRSMQPVKEYQFVLISAIQLTCFYFNMLILIPKVLYRYGWVIYVLVLLVLVAAIFFIFHTLSPVAMFGPPQSSPGRIFIFLTLATLSTSASVRLVSDRRKQERKRKEQEIATLKSELSLLRSQITPHFMFNVLNTLASLARRKSDDLEEVIIQLSHLMRYMLYSNAKKKIGLNREVEFLQSYIGIQKLRFGDESISENWNVSRDQLLIEPMLFIPILENAFKHGMTRVDDQKITISLDADEKGIRFQVSNRFDPTTVAVQNNPGIGLENIRKRLAYLYKDCYELSLKTEEDLYTAMLNLKI